MKSQTYKELLDLVYNIDNSLPSLNPESAYSQGKDLTESQLKIIQDKITDIIIPLKTYRDELLHGFNNKDS